MASWIPTLDLPLTDTSGNIWTGLLPSFSLRRQGGSWYTVPAGQITALGNGWYRVTPTTADTSVPGWLLVTAQTSGMFPAYGLLWCGTDAGPVAGLASPYYSLPFFLIDATLLQPIPGVSPTVMISPPGGSGFVAPVGSVVEVGLGVYEVLPRTADVPSIGLEPILAYSTGSLIFEDELDLIGSLTPLALQISGRIYWEDPSQLNQYPCLVVQVLDRNYGHNLAGADGHSVATVRIEAISQFQSVSTACMELVRNSFDGFRGFQSGVAIGRCFLEDEYDTTSPPLAGSNLWIYHVVTEWKIWHRVPLPTNVTQTNV